MEMHPLRVFLTVAAEKSFSRAAEKLLRTQPAISLSIQRLETELGEKLIDRSAKDLLLTDAGKTVLEYARRFENLQGDLENALAELRDKSAGRLTIGANESSTLYLLDHIERYRRRYPKIKVQIRRSLSDLRAWIWKQTTSPFRISTARRGCSSICRWASLSAVLCSGQPFCSSIRP